VAKAAADSLSDRTRSYFSNTYASEPELRKAMKPGSVVFGIRKLGALLGFEGDTDFFADNDLGAYHENVFTIDESGKFSNYDYSPNGINPDEAFPGNISEYRFSQVYTNVNVSYEALHPAGFTGANYHLMIATHNCHVYSDAVRDYMHIKQWHN
jgi:hypothetical protein